MNKQNKQYAIYQQAVEQQHLEQDILVSHSLDSSATLEDEAAELIEKAKLLQEKAKENQKQDDNSLNANKEFDLDAFNKEFPTLDDDDSEDDLEEDYGDFDKGFNDINFEENFIENDYNDDSVTTIQTTDGNEAIFYQAKYSLEDSPAPTKEKHSNKLEAWEELEQGVKAWPEFNHRDQETIVRHYAPKIRFIASRMKAKLPKHIELSELISAGTLGLLESLGKFKPQFAIRFDTYAENRIRGAMIDELRRLDWFPRSLRSKVREINQAVWKVESEHGRTPTVEEISQLTGLSEKNVTAGLEALQNQLCVPLESIQDYIASDGGANNEEDPYKNTVFGQLVDKVAGMIDILTPREKLVLSLYYTDELSMREVSEVMEITEGRVSQLHTQAIARLRKVFEGQYNDSL